MPTFLVSEHCDIVLERGAAFSWESPPLVDEVGTAIDLTGCVVALALREVKSGVASLTASSATGLLELDASAGVWVVTLPAATVATLAAGVHRYTLTITFSDGEPRRFFHGLAFVVAE